LEASGSSKSLILLHFGDEEWQHKSPKDDFGLHIDALYNFQLGIESSAIDDAREFLIKTNKSLELPDNIKLIDGLKPKVEGWFVLCRMVIGISC